MRMESPTQLSLSLLTPSLSPETGFRPPRSRLLRCRTAVRLPRPVGLLLLLLRLRLRLTVVLLGSLIHRFGKMGAHHDQYEVSVDWISLVSRYSPNKDNIK